MNVEKNGERMMRSRTNFIVLCSVLLLMAACQGMPTDVTGAGAGQASGSTTFLFSTINFILLAFLAYHFIVMRPQIEEEKAHKQFMDGLSKNDEVVTSGGIIGKVVQKKPGVVTVEIAQNTNIRVLEKDVKPYVPAENKNSAVVSKS